MMTVDCKLINDNLEAYCSDKLSLDDTRRAKTHIDGCQECRSQIESLEAIDPLVKQLFERRMAIAQMPSAPAPRRRFIPVTAAVALASILAVVFLVKPAPQPVQPLTTSIEGPVAGATPDAVDKSVANEQVDRAKPNGVTA